MMEQTEAEKWLAKSKRNAKLCLIFCAASIIIGIYWIICSSVKPDLLRIVLGVFSFVLAIAFISSKLRWDNLIRKWQEIVLIEGQRGILRTAARNVESDNMIEIQTICTNDVRQIVKLKGILPKDKLPREYTSSQSLTPEGVGMFREDMGN